MRLRVLAVLAVVLVLPARAAACRTLAVTIDAAPFRHFTTIQDAVAAAKPCDWILVAPGVYHGTVTIRTPRIHLRGLDRNRVVLDGRHQKGADGIDVAADGVWIENLTVRDFDRDSRAGATGGTQVAWIGSGKRGLRGWHGSHLTAYDTGLLGGYGLLSQNAVGGGWSQVYASGFGDAGLAVTSCRDCRATVAHALAERNAVGFAGTDAGGNLVLQDSVLRANSVGVALSSTPAGPPQLGTCDAGANQAATPIVTSTGVRRCTIVRRNRIVGNANLTAPASPAAAALPWGVGVLLLGASGDLVANNVVADNPSFGLLGLESPQPFPPTPASAYFQLSGNRIAANTFSGAQATDLALAGGVYGAKRSVANCVAGNRATTTLPADLTRWSCARATTPNPDRATTASVFATALRLEALSRSRRAVPQPPPFAQPTMLHPCLGAPGRSPLCYG